MKQNKVKWIAAGLLLLGTGTVQAQWSGTNPITTNSMVDINTFPTCTTALQTHGDVIFKDNCLTTDQITFARPFGENGMSYLCGSARADLRYNGTTLKLITRASGGAPVDTNGIVIDNAGHVGLGNSSPKYRLNVNDAKTSDYGSWVSANSNGPALWVRRDATGTFTGSAGTTGFTAGIRFALLADNPGKNTDGPHEKAGAGFFARDIGMFAQATGEGDPTAEIDGVIGYAYGKSTAQRAYSSYGVVGRGSYANKAVGVRGEGYGCTDAYGVQGIAELNTECYTPSSRSYGIYGQIVGPHTINTYAGYFDGDVHATGVVTWSSDRKLKDNIKDLDNGLATIMKLHPRDYTFSTKPEFKTMHLPSGQRHGFIAQELEEVLPELVKEISNPEIKDKDGKVISEKVDFKGVDYVSLIPYLVAGMKEQQVQIEQLKAELAAVKNSIPGNVGHNTGAASQSLLYQNKPNPADGATVIDYELVNVKTSACITVCDLNGKQVKRLPLDIGSRKGSVTISQGELAPGMYYYSLLTDNTATQTLRMIIQ